MISQIKNAWLRRLAIIAFIPLAIPTYIGAGIVYGLTVAWTDGIRTLPSDVRNVW